MIITWYGEGCFKLQSGETTLMTDLPDASTGLTAPRGKVSLHLRTLSSWPLPAPLEQADATVFGAGEYDIQGIHVRGYELPEESGATFFKTAYAIAWDDVTVGFLGHATGPVPPVVLEKLEEIDVLVVPAGGAPFMEQKEAVKLVKQLNPKVCIPSFFKIAGLKRKADDIQGFAESLNGSADNAGAEEKFVFKKKDLAEIKKTRLVCLKI